MIAEFLRLKRYENMQISHNINEDFPELRSPKVADVISGLLYVPLSARGNDFIGFLRKGQLREVHWAGKPYKDGKEKGANLEPRQSFKTWSETIAGRSRAWTDEQLETAGVLALVYGKVSCPHVRLQLISLTALDPPSSSKSGGKRNLPCAPTR